MACKKKRKRKARKRTVMVKTLRIETVTRKMRRLTK